MIDANPLPARVHEYVAGGNHDATPHEGPSETPLL